MSENIKPVWWHKCWGIDCDNIFYQEGVHAAPDGATPLYDQSAIEAARQESAAEIVRLHAEADDLRRQLAAAEAIESKLRVSLEMMLTLVRQNAPELSEKVCGYADDALSQTVGSGALDTLLAAKERETIERCAKVCESLFDIDDDTCDEAEMCAEAIRCLLNKEPT